MGDYSSAESFVAMRVGKRLCLKTWRPRSWINGGRGQIADAPACTEQAGAEVFRPDSFCRIVGQHQGGSFGGQAYQVIGLTTEGSDLVLADYPAK